MYWAPHAGAREGLDALPLRFAGTRFVSVFGGGAVCDFGRPTEIRCANYGEK